MSNRFDEFNADPHEMPRHRDKMLDDAALEELLAGTGGGPLHELLAAARAPGTARELAGEQAALAAFRATRPLGVLAPPSRRPILRRLLAVKLGVAAAVLLGGVAIAASAGYLPNPLAPAGQDPSGGSTAPPLSWTNSASLGPSPTGGSGNGSPGASPGPSALPSTALLGLCQAYLAHVESKPDKPWDNPAFGAMSALAGGDDKVLGFCTALVNEEDAKPKPSNTPTAPPSVTAPANPGTGASGAGTTAHTTTGPDGEKDQAAQ